MLVSEELVSVQVARHLARVGDLLARLAAERDALVGEVSRLRALVRALGGDATPEG